MRAARRPGRRGHRQPRQHAHQRHDGPDAQRPAPAVGPYRRGIVLPDSLKRRSVDAAKMVGDRLEVTFVTEEGAQHMSQGQP